MQASHRLSTAAFCLAASVVPSILALALPASSHREIGAQQAPQQVADNLDSIVQPRFQDLSAGKFGMTRLVPAVRGHQSIGFLGYFQTNTPAEAALLAKADAAQRPYVIAFLHCAVVPNLPNNFPAVIGDKPALRTIAVRDPGKISTRQGYSGLYLQETEPLLQGAAIETLPLALKGKPAQAQISHWALFLRPVVASQEACLTCHTTAKRGDTLGVMVYAVDKNAVPFPLKSTLAGKP